MVNYKVLRIGKGNNRDFEYSTFSVSTDQLKLLVQLSCLLVITHKRITGCSQQYANGPAQLRETCALLHQRLAK